VSKHPHIVWPAAIIGLLLLSVTTTLAIVWASQSDGGAQVVDNYYRRSVAWDSIAAARDASEHLGWTTTIEMGSSVESGYGIVTASDGDGAALIGLVGSVSVTRPQSSANFGNFELTEMEGDPGRYHFDFPFSDRGLWDVEIQIVQAELSYSKETRIEI
jgi:nitrogen fixation protein FixH